MAPVAWLCRDRALVGKCNRVSHEVRLNLDPSVGVPVDAKRERAVGVAEDHVRARGIGCEWIDGAGSEPDAFDARGQLHGAEATAKQRSSRILEPIGLLLAGEPPRATQIPTRRDKR